MRRRMRRRRRRRKKKSRRRRRRNKRRRRRGEGSIPPLSLPSLPPAHSCNPRPAWFRLETSRW